MGNVRLHIISVAAACLSIGFTGCRKTEVKFTGSAEQIIAGDWYVPAEKTTTPWVAEFDLFNHQYYSTEIPAAELHEKSEESNLILVYSRLLGYPLQPGNPNQINLLPTTVFFTATENAVDNWNYKVENGKIRITLQNSKYQYQGNEISAPHGFRYIIIPRKSSDITGYKPVNNSIMSRYTETEIRNFSYDELCNIGGLAK